MSIEPGTRIGAYEVQEVLGRGAMGVVYRAFHRQLARPAAVKVLQAIAPDPEAAARFRREAQSIAQMRHPNILQVFDYGEIGGVPYMVVEYVPGGSLADRLRAGRGRCPDQEAITLLRGIAAGLDHAHSLGVVHRDVKPANVLVGKGDTPILADFGLAKLLQSASVVSAAGMTTGTPAYMAPEQVAGGAVGPAADRYALATLAYELLTGALPFAGEGVLELLYAHVHRLPPPPSSRRPELPAAVDTVLLEGLAKEPARRWPTCTLFVEALAAALQGSEPGPAPLPALSGAGSTVVLAPPRGGRRPRRHRRLLLFGGLAAAVVLPAGLLAALAVRPPPTPALVLSDSVLTAGDTLVLNGERLPAGRSGEVQLFSLPVILGSFQADAGGRLQMEVRIPRDTTGGDHLIKLCWSGSCPVSATVRVLAVPPTPSPTPSPSPTPRPVFHPAISVSSQSLKLGSQFRVEGSGFDPERDYTLGVEQGGSTRPVQQPAPISRDGRFSVQVNLPAGLQPGAAAVVACMLQPGTPVKPDECARQPVSLTR